MNRHAHGYTPLAPAPVFSIPPIKAKISIRADTSTRRRHIRVLNDILHLSIHRREWDRAGRAWAILARCSEVDWKAMWHIGLLLIGKQSSAEDEGLDDSRAGPSSTAARSDRVDYLKTLMLRFPLRRESLLRELSLELISQERYREALDELELYLPIFSYHDNPVLHLYAGLLCLYLAQRLPSNSKDNMVSTTTSDVEPAPLSSVDVSMFSSGQARSAQRYFDRAKSLDPQNPTATAFLALLDDTFPQAGRARSVEIEEDELEDDDEDGRVHFQSHQLGVHPEGVSVIGLVNVDDEAETERGARAKKMRGFR